MASGIPTNSNQSTTSASSSQRFALSTITTLFFMWGFLTALNDILIPHLKNVFELNYTQSMFIQFTFFFAYFVMSLPSGKVIERVGFKKGIVIGLSVSGVGALLFILAASLISYALFLFALFTLASGITLLQVAANPYVSVLGPPETASSRLNLAQAFNSLGTTLAPFLGGILILSEAIYPVGGTAEELELFRLHEAASVQIPYFGLGLTLFIIALVINKMKLPKIESVTETVKDLSESTYKAALSHKPLLLGVIGIFVYVGAEVSIGSFLVNYFKFLKIDGIATEKAAAGFVSFYWGGAMIGRFIGSALMQKIKPGLLLGIFAIISTTLVIISTNSDGHIAMWSIISIGLFNSIMFPTIFTLAIKDLGDLTGKASSLLVMAIVGGAILPVLQGMLADTISLPSSFVLPALCYLFIAYYGFKGHKLA